MTTKTLSGKEQLADRIVEDIKIQLKEARINGEIEEYFSCVRMYFELAADRLASITKEEQLWKSENSISGITEILINRVDSVVKEVMELP